ncbi:hypothetical protein JZ751_006801 [Albula glossodonta]|uniref:Uncharacterized protein n=1 Tax=Albula glossodonta TaxID=121402 RepID=A0A8T2P3W6_9TELE|nr:hypothetical protein JZ751_006801 [Albula glossodonta]
MKKLYIREVQNPSSGSGPDDNPKVWFECVDGITSCACAATFERRYPVHDRGTSVEVESSYECEIIY